MVFLSSLKIHYCQDPSSQSPVWRVPAYTYQLTKYQTYVIQFQQLL